MSWDANLVCNACGHTIGDWNYTHNTNRMVELALERAGKAQDLEGTVSPWWSNPNSDLGSKSWWDLLHKAGNVESAQLLGVIVRELEATPELFRAMNPENGWGDYDGVLKSLRAMRDAIPEAPCHWEVWG